MFFSHFCCLAELLAQTTHALGMGNPEDRLVNAASRGDLQAVKEIIQTNPEKVNSLLSFPEVGVNSGIYSKHRHRRE